MRATPRPVRKNAPMTNVSMWGIYGERPEPNHDLDEVFGAMRVEGHRSIACSAEAAWALVSDISRIGEFSPECVDAWWVDEACARTVGARFEGRNRVRTEQGDIEWVRPCDVVEWVPLETFSWTVGDRFDGTPATRWRYRIEPGDGGIVLRETFAHVADGLSGIRGAAEANPDHAAVIVRSRSEDLEVGIDRTLAAMARILEG